MRQNPPPPPPLPLRLRKKHSGGMQRLQVHACEKARSGCVMVLQALRGCGVMHAGVHIHRVLHAVLYDARTPQTFGTANLTGGNSCYNTAR